MTGVQVSMSKRAVITGIYGQDGSILAESLIQQGHSVFGFVKELRSLSPFALGKASIIRADICSSKDMKEWIKKIAPTEIYHLAACHHSSEKNTDSDLFREMLNVNFHSTQVILEILASELPVCRFLFAGSSQQFSAMDIPTVVDEKTVAQPSTSYGFSKQVSMDLVKFYRNKFNLFAVTAILFNHESTRRKEQYISRKISASVARIKKQKQKEIEVRNIFAETDWSSARDFVEGMQLMLQGQEPRDFVLASGELHSVMDMLEIAFSSVGLDWQNFTKSEKSSGSQANLVGNPSAIKRELGWIPKVNFKQMVEEMVAFDLGNTDG